jgi:hypothetical protein
MRIGDRIVVSGDKNWIYAAGIGNTNISAFRLDDRITYTSTGYTTSETVEKGDNQLFITGPVGDAFGNGRTISLGTSTTIYSIVTTKYDPDIGMSVISLEQTINDINKHTNYLKSPTDLKFQRDFTSNPNKGIIKFRLNNKSFSILEAKLFDGDS